MDVKIEQRVVGHVTILNIIGRLTIDEAAQHLKNEIEEVLSRGGLHVIVNLAKVPYIDSGGLGQLVASYGSVKRAGGAMKLLNVNSRNHDLLSITRLVTVFDSFDSEAEAIRSFDAIAGAPLPH